jgi:CheY-like chemotaxis protein
LGWSSDGTLRRRAARRHDPKELQLWPPGPHPVNILELIPSNARWNRHRAYHGPHDLRGVRPGTAGISNEPTMATTADILVIEDDALMREALADWLLAAGYCVRQAADGNAGLAAVKLALPSLVITDMHMPGKNGAAVIAELKQEHPEVPVIAISGLFNSGYGMDADAVIALGAARALAKPFKRGDLLRLVGGLLESRTQ